MFNFIPPQFKLAAIAIGFAAIILFLGAVYHSIYKRGYNTCAIGYERRAIKAQNNARSNIIKIRGQTDEKITKIMQAETGDDLADPVIIDAIDGLYD